MFQTPFARAKKSAWHAKFLAPCLVYLCRDYLREVVSAPLKFWALVPHYIWDRYVYTLKIGSACLKIVSTVSKIWRVMPICLARVNGVSVHFDTKVNLWRTLFCIVHCTEMGLPFYEITQATEGLDVCIPSFPKYFETLSIGPTQGIIPTLVHCMTILECHTVDNLQRVN